MAEEKNVNGKKALRDLAIKIGMYILAVILLFIYVCVGY